MADRGPCPCGRTRAERAVVCLDCWAHADRILKARATTPEKSLRMIAYRDLLQFAASRRDKVRQPQLSL